MLTFYIYTNIYICNLEKAKLSFLLQLHMHKVRHGLESEYL